MSSEIVMANESGFVGVMAFAIWNADGRRMTVWMHLPGVILCPVMESMGYTAKWTCLGPTKLS